MDIQTEGDALVEGQLRLAGAVDVHGLFRLDVTLLVVYTGLNHTVTDGLHRQRRHMLHLIPDEGHQRTERASPWPR